MKQTFEMMAPQRWMAVVWCLATALPTVFFLANIVFGSWWYIVFAAWFGYMSVGFALRARKLRGPSSR